MRITNMVKPWQSLYQMVALKKENSSSLTEFNRIVDGLWPDDTIGHFFIVDIKFSNINLKTLVFNELYPPIFEKKKKNEIVWAIYSSTFKHYGQGQEHGKNKFFPVHF